MGHKVHPFLLRVGFIRKTHSRWFARSKDYPRFIAEDYHIRKFIRNKFKHAAISNVIIERLTEKVKIRIFSARPGIIIGRHGADIEKLREDLNTMVKKEIVIDIEEVKEPAIDAQLFAQNVALQVEKRIAYRRAIKRSIEQALTSGAKGVRVTCAGRLGGAEIARTETYRQGKIPLQTLRADIDFGFAESLTTYGLIGIKVWIYKGDILLPKRTVKHQGPAAQAPEAQETPEAPEAQETPEAPEAQETPETQEQ